MELKCRFWILTLDFSKKFGFWVIETLCIAFFTIEFILRFWSCPDRFAFMRNFMNLIDLAAIIPYYIDMGVKLYLPDGPCPDSRMGFRIDSWPISDLILKIRKKNK